MKKAKRFRLTKAAKILIMVLIVALIGGGIFAGVQTGVIQTKKDKSTTSETVAKTETTSYNEDVDKKNIVKQTETKKDKPKTADDNAINVSLDEWIGWKSIIDANGGLTTQSGSIYDKLGIKVNINIINDATQSSNALIKGDLNAAGYTINRTAFLSKKFTDAGKEVVMPYITNYSNGGDGIIAKSSIQNVNDLVNAKIGVPEFSEAPVRLP